jgi:hypothetical protein
VLWDSGATKKNFGAHFFETAQNPLSAIRLSWRSPTGSRTEIGDLQD